MSYPIVMYVREVTTPDHVTAKIKADSRKSTAQALSHPASPPQSLYFTMPIEQAPHVGAYLLVTVEIAPTPTMLEGFAMKLEEQEWQTVKFDPCHKTVTNEAQKVAYQCDLPKGHKPPCRLPAASGNVDVSSEYLTRTRVRPCVHGVAPGKVCNDNHGSVEEAGLR